MRRTTDRSPSVHEQRPGETTRSPRSILFSRAFERSWRRSRPTPVAAANSSALVRARRADRSVALATARSAQHHPPAVRMPAPTDPRCDGGEYTLLAAPGTNPSIGPTWPLPIFRHELVIDPTPITAKYDAEIDAMRSEAQRQGSLARGVSPKQNGCVDSQENFAQPDWSWKVEEVEPVAVPARMSTAAGVGCFRRALCAA